MGGQNGGEGRKKWIRTFFARGGVRIFQVSDGGAADRRIRPERWRKKDYCQKREKKILLSCIASSRFLT